MLPSLSNDHVVTESTCAHDPSSRQSVCAGHERASLQLTAMYLAEALTRLVSHALAEILMLS